MTDLSYTTYTSGSRPFGRGYQPGDPLIEGWSGTLELDVAWVNEIKPLAEQVFVIHNSDDRPDRDLCPSMSVGDVVIFGEVALTVLPEGFTLCNVDRNDIITGTTYRAWAGLQ